MPSICVTALKLRQKETDLFLFKMNSSVLKTIAHSTPRSEDNPEEIQRLLNRKRAEKIGLYLQEEDTILTNSIILNLNPEVVVTPVEDSDTLVTLEFPSDTEKHAKILDGQHRVAGFDFSGAVQLDLPIVALYDATQQQCGRIFADINSKQVRVTDVHLLSLYYQIDEDPDGKMEAMKIVDRLANEEDSPLKGKIKMHDEDKGYWVKNKMMRDRLASNTQSGGSLFNKTEDEKTAILKAYLTGVKNTWPEAWGNNADFMLTKAMGIEIVLSVFEKVKIHCDLMEGREYSAEAFKRRLQPLVDCEISMPGGGRVGLNWRTGVFSGSTNKSFKSSLNSQLIDYLNGVEEVLPAA